MGAFICQISERDWLVSRELGIYGNRINKPESREELRNQDRLSVIRDLIGVKEGDLVFFHVVRSSDQSTIRGVYEARSKAFFDSTKIWDDPYDTFPHRFLFKPHEEFKDLCLSDSYINVSEFYAKIERKKIWSQATLENERNIEKRAVRKISNEAIHKYKTRLIDMPEGAKYLRSCIDSIGNIENAIKALLMHDLRERNEFIKSIFGDVADFMNEVFVAQTTRKLFDILVINNKKRGRNYFILEAKTSQFKPDNLSQLLSYIDLFRQKELFNIENDSILGCTLSQTIHRDVVSFISLYNQLGVFDRIIMLTYEPRGSGKDAEFKVKRDLERAAFELVTRAAVFELGIKITEITEENILSLPIFRTLPNITRSIFKRSEEGNIFVLQEDQLRRDGSKERFSYVYLQILKNKLDWIKFKTFMQGLKEFVENFGEADYMETCPTIIASGFENQVLSFIGFYNTYQRRKAIKLIIANT
jgi:predicted RNA-binding protein